ncbi:cytochrome P450 [Acrocarpospora macrocephala]|uniref:Cytochrome P450 n=1 Tax=Acrocarpospora macrocephala TaxID=150177 RepID=A0A5M3WJE7_9ACTN|nr:cytochrome P450 [Acrocarpospora macrocephala]GES07163.1 cytochrome P450 [Acrocarpospora macrocephala]
MKPDVPTWPFTREDPLLPPPEFDELRAKCPITQVEMWDGSRSWLATRADDMRAILRNPVMSADSSLAGYPNSSANHAASRGGQKGFIRMDAPEHDVQRRMLTTKFSIPKVAKLREFVERLVDELLDRMEARGGPVDLLEALAAPLPSMAICEIMGLPPQDAPFLLGRVNQWMDLNSDPGRSAAAAAELSRYLDDLITERLENRGEDLVSQLLTEQFEPGNISRLDLVGMLNLLIVGGFDTTANMIGLGTVLLLRHPDQMADLRENPELMPGAIEEMLRYLSVAHHVASRVPKEDVEIRGVCIHAGEGVIAPIPAANHDPGVFAEPQRFDVRRDARSHVAFGFGIHQCLGQNLARLELQVVFTKLLSRFPTLRLAVPEHELDFRNSMIYGVSALPVAW